jgi:SAM-dependent methyltransferase
MMRKESSAAAAIRENLGMTPSVLGDLQSAERRSINHLDRPNGKGPFTFSTGDEVAVSGWAFVDPFGLRPSAAVLEVVSLQSGAVTRFNCEREARPDVVSHFHNPQLLTSGFTSHISLDRSFRGPYSVRLVQIEGERSYSNELFSFTVPLASVEADARRQLAAKFLTGSGLEVGALQRRLETPKYCTVRYVDRMPLSELRAHYPELRDQPLQEPDLIDDGETLSKVPTGSQDFVIANHFLEHCEDPIQTLGNLARVLKEGGILYMAVPDKRFTFDIDRPATPYGVLAEARRQHRRLDREAMYREWAAKVMKIPPPDVDEAARKLLDEKYSIHFNVWALPDLLEFLLKARTEFTLPLTLDWVASSDNEVILILRKQDRVTSIEG